MLCGALLVSAMPAQAFSFSSIVANLKTFVGWHSDGSSNNTVIAAASAVAIAAVAGIGYWLYKKNKTPSVPSGSFIPKADPFKIVCEQIEANDFTSAAQGINSGTFDINKKDIKGKTVLMLLFDSVTHVTREEMDLRVCHVVEVILKKKPDLSLVDYNGENVFHKAALREFCMCFGRLYLSLPKGNIDSYVLAKNGQGKTSLDWFASSTTRDRIVAEIRANGYTLNFEPQKDHDEIKRPMSDEIKRNMSDEPVNPINPLANSMSSMTPDPLWDYIADETNSTLSKTPSATTATPNFIDSLSGVTSTPVNTAAPTASDAIPQIPSTAIQTDSITSPSTAERNGTQPSVPQSNNHISIEINPHESPNHSSNVALQRNLGRFFKRPKKLHGKVARSKQASSNRAFTLRSDTVISNKMSSHPIVPQVPHYSTTSSSTLTTAEMQPYSDSMNLNFDSNYFDNLPIGAVASSGDISSGGSILLRTEDLDETAQKGASGEVIKELFSNYTSRLESEDLQSANNGLRQAMCAAGLNASTYNRATKRTIFMEAVNLGSENLVNEFLKIESYSANGMVSHMRTQESQRNLVRRQVDKDSHTAYDQASKNYEQVKYDDSEIAKKRTAVYKILCQFIGSNKTK